MQNTRHIQKQLGFSEGREFVSLNGAVQCFTEYKEKKFSIFEKEELICFYNSLTSFKHIAVLCASHYLLSLYSLSHFILTRSLRGRYYYPNLPNEETEDAQGHTVTGALSILFLKSCSFFPSADIMWYSGKVLD